MDEKYYKTWRNITKQLKNIGVPDAQGVAMIIADSYGDKMELSEEELKTAQFMLNFIEEREERAVDSLSIARGICSDLKEIKKVYVSFYKIGYSKEEIHEFYKRTPSIYAYTVIEFEKLNMYLCELGLSPIEVKDVFLKAVRIGYDETKARCETVLKYFDKKMVYELGKNFLFYAYYTDPIDCIEYIVDRLGLKLAENILNNEPMLLFLWKEKYQRNDWTHGPQHKEAMELIEKYEIITNS